MDIEKLMNEPDQFFSGVTARITEQAIEFENRCIGEALSMWQIRKEDVLKRVHEADKLQAENEKLRAERVKLEQMAACVYYKQGGLCRYGDEDPANVCVFGPCPHQRSAQEVLAELEQVKRERDVAIEQLHGHCPACAHYTPNHNEGLCRFCCFEVARNENVEINDNWEWRGQKED